MESIESESRFAQFLQPIRDLALNWNIDIAAELEEYLDELQNITFTFDDGEGSLNFAEAALVIQGSAVVYSKKVEFLYSLVYQTLDLITERRKKKKRMEQMLPADDELDQQWQEAVDEFLLLDDIQTCDDDDIELDEDLDEQVDEQPARLDITPLLSGARRATALLAVASTSQRPLAPHGSDAAHSEMMSFRMNTCAVHPSGALLLDENDLSLPFAQLPGLQTAVKRANAVFRAEGMLSSTPMVSSNLATPMAAPVGITPVPLVMPESAAAHHQQSDSVDFNELGGFDFSAASGANWNADMSDFASIANSSANTTVQSSAASANSSLAGSASTTRELWLMLDAYSTEAQAPEKPFRKGRTFRIPAKLLSADSSSSPARKKKKAASADNEQADDEDVFEYFGGSRGDSADHLRSALLPEFQYLYQEQQKYLAKMRRQLLAHARSSSAQPRLRSMAQQLESAADAADPLDQSAFDFGGADDFGGFNESDFVVNDNDELGFSLDLSDSAASLSRIHRRGGAHRALDEGDSQQPLGYEDLCRKYVDDYLASAEQYVRQSAITKRVTEWQNKLAPKLHEQQERESFDIKTDGARIFDSVQQYAAEHDRDVIGLTVEFSRIIEKNIEAMPSYEIERGDRCEWLVCRRFAAALQLVNDGNLDVVTDEHKQFVGFKVLSVMQRGDVTITKQTVTPLKPTKKLKKVLTKQSQNESTAAATKRKVAKKPKRKKKTKAAPEKRKFINAPENKENDEDVADDGIFLIS